MALNIHEVLGCGIYRYIYLYPKQKRNEFTEFLEMNDWGLSWMLPVCKPCFIIRNNCIFKTAGI